MAATRTDLLGWSGRAVRAGVYLVLGGVIAAGYLILVIGIVQLAQAAPAVPVALTVAITAIAIPIALTPPLLTPVRDIEVAAARALLGVDIPTPTSTPSRDDRLRAAGYFGAHLLLGGAAVTVLLFGIPYALGLVGWAVGVRGDGLQVSAPALGAWGIPLAIVLLAALPPLALLGGAVLRSLALPLLGPSAADRALADRQRLLVLAERNRIARELHDSVGHALAITTMQASVAQSAIGTDDASARAAVEEIARAGRTAMADLDRSLAVLREEGQRSPAAPARDLTDLRSLAEASDAVGRPLRLTGDPDDLALDASTSREAYRLIAEAVVNARRHGIGPIDVRWRRADRSLTIEVSNAVGQAAAGPGGRGLIGMRERAALIGADLETVTASDRWTVRLTIPLEAA